MKKFLFRMFKRDLIRLLHEGLPRNKRFPLDRFDFAFYDLDGMAYYLVKGDKHPILRKINLGIAFAKLHSGISELDISESIQAIYRAINQQDDKGRMSPDIATLGFICTQLLGRKGRIVVSNYLYELAGNYFVREDEDIDFVDDKILSEKIEAIKQLPIEVLRTFFFSKQLNEIFPYADNPEEFFADILREGEIETMAYLYALKDKSNGNSN